MPLILLGLGVILLVARSSAKKGSAEPPAIYPKGGVIPPSGWSDENYVDAKGRTWRIHRNTSPTSAGTLYPPPGAVMVPTPGSSIQKSADFITIPEGTSRDVVIHLIDASTAAETASSSLPAPIPQSDATLPTPPSVPGTSTALGIGGEPTTGPWDISTPQGAVGMKPPWAYAYNDAPNGDYDLVWIYFDKFPTEMYVAAKRGTVERGNWYSPPSKLMTRPLVDSVDLRGGVTLERSPGTMTPSGIFTAGFVAGRAPNGHTVAVIVDPTIGPAINLQSAGPSPYGSSLGAALSAIVSNAYPGIPALGATAAAPASPFGALGSMFGV